MFNLPSVHIRVMQFHSFLPLHLLFPLPTTPFPLFINTKLSKLITGDIFLRRLSLSSSPVVTTVALGSVASASLGNYQKCSVLGYYTRLTELETLGIRPQSMVPIGLQTLASIKITLQWSVVKISTSISETSWNGWI